MENLALIIVTGISACAIFWVIYFFSFKERAMPTHLNKVLSVNGWATSQKSDRLQPVPIDIADNFIHLATDDQLNKVLEKFWHNEPSYVVVKVDPKLFIGRLVHEVNPGGSNKYYHLYDGYIPLTAVIDARVIEK